MTETSYTAWDDKLYQWPPPEGWYEAGDGKWWPEGYGPDAAQSGAEASGPGALGDESSADDAMDAVHTAIGAAGDGLTGGAETALTGTADADLGGGAGFAGFADAVEDASAGSVPGALAGAAGDVMPDSVSDAIGSATNDAVANDAVTTDAVPQGLADAASGVDSFGRDASGVPAALAGAVPDALSGVDRPESDDVGAALADTLSPRSDDLADPASSGIPGSGSDSLASLADAAAEATQFMSTDLPRPDLGGSGGPVKTDLDALPPPAWAPPPADGAPTVTEAADDLADLAEPAVGFSGPGVEGPGGSSPLLSGPAGDGGFAPPPTDGVAGAAVGGFDGAPIDETLPPSLTGSGEHLADAADFPGHGADGSVVPDVGRPDETMMAPLTGSTMAPSDAITNPAETGQFNVSPPDAATWTAPPPSHYDTPPPAPAGGPGAAPWGQSGAPGGQPAPAGLDQAILETPTRSGSSRTLLLVGLGVIALLLLGVAAFLVFGGDESDGGTAVAQTGPGSLAEPHTRTTPVEIFYPDGDAEQRFVIEVLEPVRDASGEADGESPSDGEVFAVTRVRVTNQTSSDAPVADLRFNAVNAAGDLIERESNSCTTTEPPLDYAATLGEAGVAEGVVCWAVPATDLAGLMLGIESTRVGGRIHINLQ